MDRAGRAASGSPTSAGLTQLVSGLMAALETFDTPLDMTEVSRTFGVTPTTIDELLAERQSAEKTKSDTTLST